MTDTRETSRFQAPAGFRARKAAQICAYFASKNREGKISKLKLSKLVYICERTHLERYHSPMLYDDLYSLTHGPVCSHALRGMEGYADQELWSGYIGRHGKDRIFSAMVVTHDDLDHLSAAEIALLDEVWQQYSHMSTGELRALTHGFPEYTETHGSMPISYQEVFKAFGENEESASALESDIDQHHAMEDLIAKYE